MYQSFNENFLKQVTLVSNDNSISTLDLILDTFQNLILDCKSVSNSGSNKYIINFYDQYKAFYDKISKCRMKYEDFNVLKVIGQGAFGQVKLVRHKESNELFALKILNKSQVVSCEGTIFWQEEREIMININSRWLVKLHYAFQDPRRLYMVMDYLPGGNLVNWMNKLESIEECDVCFYAAEIVLAIYSLHQLGFVHRDIKPDNILFDKNGHIKLADFGSCVKMDPVTKFVNCNRAIGTPDYISPEVLLSQSDNIKYGKEVDWWAMGVMLYEIFYAELPFYSDTLINTYGKIMTHEQNLSFPPDDDVSDRALDFMKNLICDRSRRLGQSSDAEDIKSHRFFTHYEHLWNWSNINEKRPPFIPKFENDLDTSYFDFDDVDGDRKFSSENNQELQPSSFIGENLQFSGFSYTRYGNGQSNIENLGVNTKSDKPQDKTQDEVDHTLVNLSKENQKIKNALDLLLIEKKDLESQVLNLSNSFQKEENISRKLQIDYSQLKARHSNCQQKIESLEEINHKLSSDLVKLQASTDSEKQILSTDIQNLDSHLKKSNLKLMEIQTEYHQIKLKLAKLETEHSSLQEAYNSLEKDFNLSKNGSSVQSKNSVPNDEAGDISLKNEYNKLRLDFDAKINELSKSHMENKSLKKTAETLGMEKEQLTLTLMDLESRYVTEAHATRKYLAELHEKNALLVDMKSEIDKNQLALDDAIKQQSNINQRMMKLMKMKNAEKTKFDQEIEDQRNKLSKIITSKTLEIQQMKFNIENLTESNTKLLTQMEVEKMKQDALVKKINEIMHGKCSAANEILNNETGTSTSFIHKRSSRLYFQLSKEAKKLESMYDDLQKASKLKEFELKKQIETLTKEKEQLILENTNLQENVVYYENLSTADSTTNRESVSTIASSQGSFDSGFPTDSSLQNRRPIKIPQGKPPSLSYMHSFPSSKPLNHTPGEVFHDNNGVDQSSDVKLRTKRFTSSESRQHSKSSTLSMEFPTQLEVNVKVKGKKMSWEKRFIKHDDQFVYFYEQDMESYQLKLSFSSLMFVRSVSTVDVIHAKKSEIPRIFQICYDKNELLLCLMKQFEKLQKSVCRSSSSINSGDSSSRGSGQTTSSHEAAATATATGPDQIDKQQIETRKNSVTRFIPLLSGRGQKLKESADLSIDLVNQNSVFLRGHLFQLKESSTKPTNESVTKSIFSTPSTPRVKTRSSSTLPRLVSDGNSSGVVSPDRTYQCHHCSLVEQGHELNSKIFTCKQSVVIQLCRAPSESDQAQLIKYFNQFIKGHNIDMSSVTVQGSMRSFEH